MARLYKLLSSFIIISDLCPQPSNERTKVPQGYTCLSNGDWDNELPRSTRTTLHETFPPKLELPDLRRKPRSIEMMDSMGIFRDIEMLRPIVLRTEVVLRIESKTRDSLFFTVENEALLETGFGYVDDIRGRVIGSILP